MTSPHPYVIRTDPPAPPAPPSAPPKVSAESQRIISFMELQLQAARRFAGDGAPVVLALRAGISRILQLEMRIKDVH